MTVTRTPADRSLPARGPAVIVDAGRSGLPTPRVADWRRALGSGVPHPAR